MGNVAHDGEHSQLATYQRIANDLRAAIERGDYGATGKLPSEAELCRTYGVARGTVRQAFSHLRAIGVITSRRGVRRQIQQQQEQQPMSELLSFSRWARGIGQNPSSRTLSMDTVPAFDTVAEQLGVKNGDSVFHVHRVRLLDSQPVMIESTYYPAYMADWIAQSDLDTESISDRLEYRGIVLAEAEHRIDAVEATPHESELLEVPPQTALLRTSRRTIDQNGRPAEYSIDMYRGSAVAFIVHNSTNHSQTVRVNR